MIDSGLFQRPTLLCLGGSETGEGGAHNFTLIGRAMLGANESASPADPMFVASAGYQLSHSTLSIQAREYSNAIKSGTEYEAYGNNHGVDSKKPAFKIDDYVVKFARENLFPLVEDTKTHKAYSLDQAKRNLRNVHVLAHGYGGAFMQQAGEVLVQRMQELNFSNAEIKEATSQVLVVEAGTTALPASGKASFTTLDVVHWNDKVVRDNAYDPQWDTVDTLAKKRGLVVNRKLEEVPEISTARTYNQRLAEQWYPKKSVNIMPVTFKRGAGKVEINPDERSNHFLFVVSPPFRPHKDKEGNILGYANAIGDVVPMEALNSKGTVKKLRGNPTGQPHNDPDGEQKHIPQVYFHYHLQDDGQLQPNSMLMRTAISAVLANAMNNSIRNSRPGAKFEELPKMTELVKLPQGRMEYDVAPDADFRQFASHTYDTDIGNAFAFRPSHLTRVR